MDELKAASRKKLVIDALALIEDLKTILALRGQRGSDLMRKLFEMEMELEMANCNHPETDTLLQKFSLLNQEILDGVEFPPKDKLS